MITPHRSLFSSAQFCSYWIGVSLSLLLLWSVSAVGQSTVEFLGNINVPHGTSAQGTKYSSCWGWVSPRGEEYALLGTYTGTSIIDLNSDSLREVAFIPGPTASYAYREMKTYKQYAYIVSEGGRGIQIVDLSGLPDTAILVKEFVYRDGRGRHIEYSHTITQSEGYLYCNGSSGWSPGGMVVFSLHNDPTTPEFVETLEPAYIHDSYARDGRLYGAAIYDGGGLFVYDISQRDFIFLMGQIEYEGSGTHNAWSSIDGKYAFTTDEVGSTTHDLKIWDITALPSYSLVAQYQASPNSIIHNVHGRGNYAYIAHYTAGMRVVDVHDPGQPVEVGALLTYQGTREGYFGCWGVFPYFPSGKWIGSDMETGLYVCRFKDLLPRSRPNVQGPSGTISDSVATFTWTSAANQLEDPHFYDLYIVGGDIDTSYRTTDTTLTVSLTLLRRGVQYRAHVMVGDDVTEVSGVDTLTFTYEGPTAVVDDKALPLRASLEQNFPNPFNPETDITFSLPDARRISLEIYDPLGRLVALPVASGMFSAGTHSVRFNANGLASGVYYVKLRAEETALVRKIVLAK